MLIELPNGQVADIPDDASPDVVARIKQQNAATPKSRTEAKAAGVPRKALTAEQQEVGKRVGARRKMERTGINSFGPLQTFNDMTTAAQKGYTFSFGDELAGGVSALTRGAYNAITKGDIGEIGKEYRVTRDTERALQRDAETNSPTASTIGELTGAVMNPLGTGEKALTVAGKALGTGRAGRALTRAGASFANRGTVAKSVVAGTNQGALNAAGNARELSDVPGASVTGGLGGAVAGLVLGGGGQALQLGVDAFKRSRPGNAANNAYERIAEMLDAGKTTPQKITREIGVTDARGGDAMVGEMLPSLRAQAAALARKPNLPSSNDLIQRGEDRIWERGARFVDQARKASGITDDAMVKADSLSATRKAAGERDYGAGGVMDQPVQWGEDLRKFFNEAPEQTNQALRKAYDEMLLRRENPAEMGFSGDGTFNAIPNLRSMDYVKRGFDAQIGAALKAGDRATAQGLSSELNRLKGLLSDSNPQYKGVLATQRDLFQKQDALEFGTKAIQHLAREPRLVLKEIRALEPNAQQEARIGIIDALASMDNKADPVAAFRNISRNLSQKKVLEFAFGGRGNLGRFERFVNREVRATRTDAMTAPGRQSATSTVNMADDSLNGGGDAGNVIMKALRGFFFGGAGGAITNTAAALKNLSTGTNLATQEEIAKILLSKGVGLTEGVAKAQEKALQRNTRNTRRAIARAKGGQQLFTSDIQE